MKTKTVFKNLAILLVFTLGIFTIYSFTSSTTEAKDLTVYDASYYQNIDANSATASFTAVIDSSEKCGDGKCGDDKKAKDAKAKDAKTEDGKCGADKKSATDKEAKCGEGKCGDDKASKDSTATKEGKEAKCGEGKCG